MNIEAWRKNENTSSFDRLVKGTLLTVEGYFKPDDNVLFVHTGGAGGLFAQDWENMEL